MERIANYGHGVSSLVNCFLRRSSLIQLSPLCAIKHTVVRTISSQHFCFQFYKLYHILCQLVVNFKVGCLGCKAEEENQYKRDSSHGAWLGSHEGLFYMRWLWVWMVLHLQVHNLKLLLSYPMLTWPRKHVIKIWSSFLRESLIKALWELKLILLAAIT